MGEVDLGGGDGVMGGVEGGNVIARMYLLYERRIIFLKKVSLMIKLLLGVLFSLA